MIAAGYMAKRVAKRPEGLKAGQVVDVYSVSGCISENFTVLRLINRQGLESNANWGAENAIDEGSA